MVKRRCALRAPALSILLGVSLLGTEPAAAGDPQAAAWAQVGLRWDPLRSRLRNRPCNSDRDRFEAVIGICDACDSRQQGLVGLDEIIIESIDDKLEGRGAAVDNGIGGQQTRVEPT